MNLTQLNEIRETKKVETVKLLSILSSMRNSITHKVISALEIQNPDYDISRFLKFADLENIEIPYASTIVIVSFFRGQRIYEESNENIFLGNDNKSGSIDVIDISKINVLREHLDGDYYAVLPMIEEEAVRAEMITNIYDRKKTDTDHPDGHIIVVHRNRNQEETDELICLSDFRTIIKAGTISYSKQFDLFRVNNIEREPSEIL